MSTIRRTYFGANVRIEHRGAGLEGSLVVQQANPLTDGWIDYRSFYESSDYCYTEAKECASNLAAKLMHQLRTEAVTAAA